MVSKAYAKSFADHSFGNIRSIYQYEQQEPLTETAIQMILGTRSLHKRKVTLKTDKLSQYFDEHYSSEELPVYFKE